MTSLAETFSPPRFLSSVTGTKAKCICGVFSDPKSGFNNLNEESVPEEELSEEERELLGLTEKREVLSQDEKPPKEVE